jgi:hypothetical protein
MGREEGEPNVFSEASRFEERENEIPKAVEICKRGLEYFPQNPILLLQMLRLYEKADKFSRVALFSKGGLDKLS